MQLFISDRIQEDSQFDKFYSILADKKRSGLFICRKDFGEYIYLFNDLET